MTKLQIANHLENLREQEITHRAALVDALQHLANAALRAADKIATREWADGLACIDSDIEDFRSFQDDLENTLHNIEHAEWQLDNEYFCNGCGREESECSADPCPDVIADREA